METGMREVGALVERIPWEDRKGMGRKMSHGYGRDTAVFTVLSMESEGGRSEIGG